MIEVLELTVRLDIHNGKVMTLLFELPDGSALLAGKFTNPTLTDALTEALNDSKDK